MTPCKNGIVRLEDLPNDEIFVKLKSKFHKYIESKIRNFGIKKFEKKIGSGRKIGHWLMENSLIRLDILLKILDYFNLSYNNNILIIRGKDGLRIKNPKITFDFTSLSGVRILAGILGDGCIPKNRTNPYYTNSDKNLTNGFIEDMKKVFGDIEFNSRMVKKKNTIMIILEFSSLVYKIFLKVGLKPGKKVETNQNIPNFIFNLDKIRKFAFISQFFDDEGSVNPLSKYVKLTYASLERYGKPALIEDIEKLLSHFDIQSSVYPDRVYCSSRGEDRRVWRLQINGQFQLKELYRNLNLRSLEKKRKFESLLKSIKLRKFRNKEYLSIYQDFMKKIQNSKGYFTSWDLSSNSGMTIGSCRNLILRFSKLGLIKCIKPYKSGNDHEYAYYILGK
tara:strand:+ start:12515 stop:13690 length:1176 start_codon:yes stop_codon:yes gene_type:complete